MDTTILLSKCLIEREHIGYTEYFNICTGLMTASVSWTPLQWFGAGSLTALTVAILGFFIWIFCVDRY